MNKMPDTAVVVIERESGSFFYSAPAPENSGNRIITLKMISGSRNQNITFGTDKSFVPRKMIPTGMTNPREKKTQKVVNQIIQIIHAAR